MYSKKSYTIRLFSFFFIYFFLQSCGFEPLYQYKNKKTLLNLRSISIDKIEGKESSDVKEALLKMIMTEKKSPAKYSLHIKTESFSTGIVTNANTRIVRYEIEIIATYTLFKNTNDNKKIKILSSNLSERSSHRILPNNISSTIIGEKAAISRAIESIAKSIYDELSLMMISYSQNEYM